MYCNPASRSGRAVGWTNATTGSGWRNLVSGDALLSPGETALRYEVFELGGKLCCPTGQFFVCSGEQTPHLQVMVGRLTPGDHGRPDLVADALFEDDDGLKFVGGQHRLDHRIDNATAKLRKLGVTCIGHSGRRLPGSMGPCCVSARGRCDRQPTAVCGYLLHNYTLARALLFAGANYRPELETLLRVVRRRGRESVEPAHRTTGSGSRQVIESFGVGGRFGGLGGCCLGQGKE